jgi:hypothetical protein
MATRSSATDRTPTEAAAVAADKTRREWLLRVRKCMYHPDLAGTPRKRLEARIRTLQDWPRNFLDALDSDPRCGCGAPDAECEWDSPQALEALL